MGTDSGSADALMALGPPLLGIGVRGHRLTIHGQRRGRRLWFVEDGAAAFPLTQDTDELWVADERVIGGRLPRDTVIAEASRTGGGWVPVRMARGVWLATAPLRVGVRVTFRDGSGTPVEETVIKAAETDLPEARRGRSHSRARRLDVRSHRQRGRVQDG